MKLVCKLSIVWFACITDCLCHYLVFLKVGKEEVEENKLDLPSVMEVLTKQLQRGTVPSKVASLRWIYHLFIQIPVQMFQYIDDIFPVLLKTLSDTSDEVVILDLEVLAEISSSKIGHTTRFKQLIKIVKTILTRLISLARSPPHTSSSSCFHC